MSWWKIRYNKKSAKKHGWAPFWFGATQFDQFLIECIKGFQRDHDLTADGLCGPETYRRAYTYLEARVKPKEESDNSSFILCDGEKVKVDWGKVKIDPIKSGCYKSISSHRTLRWWSPIGMPLSLLNLVRIY